MDIVSFWRWFAYFHNVNYQWYVLYISGNETKDASKAHLSTVARKPEETCKQERLLCEPETLDPYSSAISIQGSFTCTTLITVYTWLNSTTSHPKDEASGGFKQIFIIGHSLFWQSLYHKKTEQHTFFCI